MTLESIVNGATIVNITNKHKKEKQIRIQNFVYYKFQRQGTRKWSKQIKFRQHHRSKVTPKNNNIKSWEQIWTEQNHTWKVRSEGNWTYNESERWRRRVLQVEEDRFRYSVGAFFLVSDLPFCPISTLLLCAPTPFLFFFLFFSPL